MFFLGVFPGILFAIFLVYYSRRNSIFFWKKPKGSSYVQTDTESSSCFSFFTSSSSSSIFCVDQCSLLSSKLDCCACFKNLFSCFDRFKPQTDVTEISVDRPKITIEKKGLNFTTNEHVKNNFASYRSRVLSLQKGVFGYGRDDKRSSKVVGNETEPVMTTIPKITVDEAPNQKNKIYEKNVKGLKVDVNIKRVDIENSPSTASTYCASADIITESSSAEIENYSVKTIKEKLLLNLPANNSTDVRFQTGSKSPKHLSPNLHLNRKT